MRDDWQSHLEAWIAAGLLDERAAGSIRAWESEHAQSRGLRWPVAIALALGALLLGAGVLLFVSAHWEDISPLQRLALVLVLTAGFHVGGALTASRFEGLAAALHTTGTLALGAGIALTGQIFNLSEHWPAAILLWSCGAVLAWALLRHWTQAALTCILIPCWLFSEWDFAVTENQTRNMVPAWVFLCGLCFAYLTARAPRRDSLLRKALAWTGGICLIPAIIAITIERWDRQPSWQLLAIAWIIAAGVPIAAAILLRGRAVAWNVISVLWAVILAFVNRGRGDYLLLYVWCALGAVGLIAWGVAESRPERINLGVAGFAITVLAFYFSSVMDKLGRSASLILLGLLFTGGAWLLERTRRRLIAHMRPEPV